jgi:hypothetical protein
MTRLAHVKRFFVLIALVLAVLSGTATDARAQGFFTALVGETTAATRCARR